MKRSRTTLVALLVNETRTEHYSCNGLTSTFGTILLNHMFTGVDQMLNIFLCGHGVHVRIHRVIYSSHREFKSSLNVAGKSRPIKSPAEGLNVSSDREPSLLRIVFSFVHKIKAIVTYINKTQLLMQF